MTDLITDTKALAKAYSIEFKDCGNGHIQLRAHGNLINYWPNSKKKTLQSPTLGRSEKNVLPWDAIQMCLTEAKKGMRPMKKSDIPKNRPAFDLKSVTTNPAGIKHLYTGKTPPWEGTGFEFNQPSDKLRHEAWSMEQKAISLRVDADEMDEAA